MAETINEWNAPCGCVIRFKFDPEEPEVGRKHTAVDHPGRHGCSKHAHADHHSHYRALRSDHLALATAAKPDHGWRLQLEDDGGIRDMRG